MNTLSTIRLNKLSIKNYKRLDSLEIEFPQPVMKNDADILVFGSKNGGGKTSILECCSLLMLAATIGERVNRFRDSELLFDVASLLIKAGQQESIISGEFEYDSKKCTVSLTIDRKHGFTRVQTEGSKLFELFSNDKKNYLNDIDYFLNSVLSFSSEPLIIPPLLHFNSYRKVQESNPELGMMSDDYSSQRNMRFPSMRRNLGAPVISSFKLEIVRSLMGKAALFEGIYQQESELVLTKLNTLIEQYCGGQIENLRPLPNNKVDIRIKPIGGQESFSFDGLSSGQKEIIATLFLIWKNTQTHSGIVLIDEPELHLNPEWQGDFVRQLHKLAPHNQYILATHSEEIFRSVDESYRAILTSDDETGENQ
ncbi:MAG: AAA family ATPase [Methylococcaceae bacterium]|jgi:predicted ATPase